MPPFMTGSGPRPRLTVPRMNTRGELDDRCAALRDPCKINRRSESICAAERMVIGHGLDKWYRAATPDRRPDQSAGADSRGRGVVAGVVETPWTGGAIRDAVRHRDAVSSADTGLRGRGESAWTGAGLLITQRSRVQIPPPLPRPEALSRTEKGPSACGS
jgi:hypothetical protein